MKKRGVFLCGAVILFCVSAGAQTSRFAPSILSGTTYGTFSNVLDAAQTIDEAETDVAFSNVGKDYFFGGVMANPNLSSPAASSVSPVFGYYRAGDRPWSLFGQVLYTGTGEQTVVLDNGAGLTRKPYYRGFDQFNTDLQFLMNFGAFSTGLRLTMDFSDNKTIDDTTNVQITNPDGTVEKYISNDFISDVAIGVPFYTRTGDLKHYGEFMLVFNNVDLSTETTIGGTTTRTPDTSGRVVPAAYYKMSMPLGPNDNQASFFGLLAVPFGYGDSGVKVDYHPGVVLGLGAKYRMYFSTLNGWLKFRMTPQALYQLNFDTGVEGTSDISNSVDLSLAAAFDFRPESWIVGFMLGSNAHVTYTNTTETEKAGSGAVTQIVNNDWDTSVDFAVGIYFPLPNDYRLDITFAPADNITQFGNLTVQLIVPLN